MKRAEISRKFDEIVAFSEIEQFLDTPVKRYSSGMYVRLAFAVAAHLEPEILIVDEVLAVGDYAFQKKCLGKMHDVSSGDGRTILFVSHNMSALTQLCEHGILLEDGRSRRRSCKRRDPDVFEVEAQSKHSASRLPPDPSKPCQYVSAEIVRSDGELGSDFISDEPVTIRLQFEIREPTPSLFLAMSLHNLDGTQVLFSDVRDMDPAVTDRLGVGLHTFEISIPPRLLRTTTYLLTVTSVIQFAGVVDQHDACCEFVLRDLSSVRAVSTLDRSCVLGLGLPWAHRRFSSTNGHSPVELHSSLASQP